MFSITARFFLVLSVSIRVHPWFQFLHRGGPFPWRGLAARAVMAASARYDYAANDRLAAKTGLAIALINAVPELEIAGIPFGIDII